MTMYKIFVDKMVMPLGTPKLTTSIKNRDKEKELINGEVMSVPKAPGLSEWKFDVLLPDPDPYLKKFSELKLSQKPFSFVVQRSETPKNEDGSLGEPTNKGLKSTSVLVTLSDWKRIEDANYGLMSKVELSFREYRHFVTSTVTLPDEFSQETIQLIKNEVFRLELLDPPKEYLVEGKTVWAGSLDPMFGGINVIKYLPSWETLSMRILGSPIYKDVLRDTNSSMKNDGHNGYDIKEFPGEEYPRDGSLLKIDVENILNIYYRSGKGDVNELRKIGDTSL